MAVIKNIGRSGVKQEAAKAGEPAKPKSVDLLEGLLSPEERVVTPLNPGRNKLKPATKAPEKPAGLLKKLRKLRMRHAVIVGSFIAGVAIPASLSTFYMIFVAADQYHSSASFAVRSIDAASGGDLMGLFTQASSGNTTSDSYILIDYIRSSKMLAEVEQKFDLDSIFAVRGLDYFYGLWGGEALEDKLAYWRNMVRVNFDHASGIMELEVRAFDPVQSQEIAKFVIQKSDELVNNLSSDAREGVLRASREEVELSEKRLAEARVALRAYRDQSQEVDPVEGAKLALQIVGGLEAELVKLNSDLATARTQMGDDTPRMRVLKARIESLEQQLATERQRLGSGDASGTEGASSDVAGRIQKYESLETEREFAERAYGASLASLEKARMDASSKQRYLATFIEPTLSELAQYPSRLLNSFIVTLGLLFAWAVFVMGYYNIRDRN
ncbi:RkpR, polysaccharide export protein [Pararhizobium arenae]|uniref:RkpR, polysaccharide export protein n=1 Tax=Pararhizobium arenae TaxID=1856850 RepID=UPI00094AD0B7|nr:RkpR, polysaccharide export protein [Pararhizobium arenae]